MERTSRRNRKRRYEGSTTTRRRPSNRRRERTTEEKEDTSFVHTVEEGGEFKVGDYLFEAGDKIRIHPKDKSDKTDKSKKK